MNAPAHIDHPEAREALEVLADLVVTQGPAAAAGIARPDLNANTTSVP